MPKPDLSAIIDATFELEGLLSLTQRPGADLQVLLRLIARKASHIAETAESMTITSDISAVNPASDNFYIAHDASDREASSAGPEDDLKNDLPCHVTDIDTEPTVESHTGNIWNTAEESSESEEKTETYSETSTNENKAIIQADDSDRPAESEKESGEAAKGLDNVLHFEFDYPDNQEIKTEDSAEIPVKASEQIAASFTPRRHVEPEEPQKFVRGIRTLFSINDKFRFRRELFNSSDSEFSAAIDTLQEFDSIADAEDYLYSELQLDPDNVSVKEFITLIDKYYSQL